MFKLRHIKTKYTSPTSSITGAGCSAGLAVGGRSAFRSALGVDTDAVDATTGAGAGAGGFSAAISSALCGKYERVQVHQLQ